MLVAALDTATLVLSCALVDLEPGAPPRLRCERTEHAPAKGPASAERRRHRAEGGPTRPPGGHGARLPGALSDLLVAEGLKLPDVEGYAIGLGPGSFTGLRIGLATWKGLAYANRRPIAGASSLAAMALAARPGVAEGAILVPLLDARKGEVYAGFYRAEGEGIARVAPEAALPPAALAERVAGLGPAAVAFGEGLAAYPEPLSAVPRLSTPLLTPPAWAVAALAAERLLRPFDAQALFALEPHYVRPSEAEVKFPHGLGPGAQRA
ncbi:MAG TPA: tRNA (adenosine(37)-N6)-threonylcarbamoyltransferase complex dimerization subunit type 1 TsaB [Anaeromyxobacter sp.]|nr:tRNA (adenosine(37)-N6)-threonylcarbamoyltransferase complex dimerization subunit type 1 TsaB [Anaeromyxobacter sp.]